MMKVRGVQYIPSLSFQWKCVFKGLFIYGSFTCINCSSISFISLSTARMGTHFHSAWTVLFLKFWVFSKIFACLRQPHSYIPLTVIQFSRHLPAAFLLFKDNLCLTISNTHTFFLVTLMDSSAAFILLGWSFLDFLALNSMPVKLHQLSLHFQIEASHYLLDLFQKITHFVKSVGHFRWQATQLLCIC